MRYGYNTLFDSCSTGTAQQVFEWGGGGGGGAKEERVEEFFLLVGGGEACLEILFNFSKVTENAVIMITLERLRSRLFSISCEPRTSRSHVTTALASGLQFAVHVFTARLRSRGK